MTTTIASGLNWSHLARRVAGWHKRSRAIWELETLSEATRRDIGLTGPHWSSLVR